MAYERMNARTQQWRPWLWWFRRERWRWWWFHCSNFLVFIERLNGVRSEYVRSKRSDCSYVTTAFHVLKLLPRFAFVTMDLNRVSCGWLSLCLRSKLVFCTPHKRYTPSVWLNFTIGFGHPGQSQSWFCTTVWGPIPLFL